MDQVTVIVLSNNHRVSLIKYIVNTQLKHLIIWEMDCGCKDVTDEVKAKLITFLHLLSVLYIV